MEVYSQSEFERLPGVTSYIQFKEVYLLISKMQQESHDKGKRIAELVNQIKFLGRTLQERDAQHRELAQRLVRVENMLTEKEFVKASEIKE